MILFYIAMNIIKQKKYKVYFIYEWEINRGKIHILI